LDSLLVRVFELSELLQYLETLTDTGSRPVLQHVYDLLLHEDVASGDGADERIDIEALKQKCRRNVGFRSPPHRFVKGLHRKTFHYAEGTSNW